MGNVASADVPCWLDLTGKIAEHHPRFLKDLADIESHFLADPLNGVSADRPIYICGLARAGSTILLEILASHSDTASHRYRDFPFPFIPVWWNTFLDRATGGGPEAVERFHEDRIRAGPESPEAMEEPIWMAFFPHCHDPERSNVLGTRTRRPTFARFYRSHLRKMIRLRGGNRYLAKNNYNITRIEYLHRLFPRARFLLPMRAPVHHVASSMRQQRIFSRKLEGNRRALDYLRRAGHFEFGPLRRPINTGDETVTERIQQLWETGRECEGWAVYWRSIYRFVADLLEGDPELRQSALVVPYKRLCGESSRTLRAIYGHTDLEVGPGEVARQAELLSAPDYYDLPFGAGKEKQIRKITEDTHARLMNLQAKPF